MHGFYGIRSVFQCFQRNSISKTTVSFKIAHSIRQIVISNFSPTMYIRLSSRLFVPSTSTKSSTKLRMTPVIGDWQRGNDSVRDTVEIRHFLRKSRNNWAENRWVKGLMGLTGGPSGPRCEPTRNARC